MKYPAAALALILLTACNQQPTAKQDAVTLRKDVFALHDHTMVRGEELYSLQRRLKTRLDTLTKLPPPAATSARARLLTRMQQAYADGQAADKAMSAWMAGFEPPAEKTPADSAAAYLLRQKKTLFRVTMQIESSIAYDETLLKSDSLLNQAK